jgi:D-threo-aldose 1-dehydrogenase
MKYRKLGRTGVDVSELVFSCAETVGMMTAGNYETAFEAVKRALDAGINWFDTSPSDTDGEGEEILGRILKELDAHLFISAKVVINPGASEDIADQVERALEKTLKRLQIDQLDLFQLHNWIDGATGERALNVESVLGREGAIAGMETLREKGLLKWIGATALGDTGLSRRLIESRRVDTALVYINMINPTAAHRDPMRTLDAAMPKASRGQDFTGVLDCCADNDVGVIAIRILAAGAIIGELKHYKDRIVTKDTNVDDVAFKASAIREMLGDSQGSLAQAAIRFVLAHPAIATINFGARNLDEFEEGLAAVAMGPLPEAVMAELDALFHSNFGRD